MIGEWSESNQNRARYAPLIFNGLLRRDEVRMGKSPSPNVSEKVTKKNNVKVSEYTFYRLFTSSLRYAIKMKENNANVS